MADEKKEYEYKPFEYNVPWDATGKYNTFTPGDAYNTALTNKQNAESAYTNHVGNGYTWANQDMLKTAIANWQGRNPFSYDFNTDAMYQQYKDKYIKQGKMAMQDTMGQAAAMTGGYGSSYASTAGNQAYQASLENLNDIIPQLYQMAYDRYNQEGQDMLNNISLLQSERGFDYGVWGDKANMLANDRGYYQTEANNLWNRDYGVWDSNRTFDRGVWESDRTLAHGEHTNSENIRYDEHRNAIADEQWRQQFEFQKQQYEDSKNTPVYTGGGAIGDTDGDEKFDKATFSRVDEDGNYVFYRNGKEQKFAKGVNPYTGGTNKDIKHGTFSNGYQPNNVNGKKLSKSGITDVVNGVTQNVWKTSDGKLWIWDGTQNRYLEYQD